MQDGWSQFCLNCLFLLYKLSFHFAELSFYFVQTVVLICSNCHFMVSLDFVRTVILFGHFILFELSLPPPPHIMSHMHGDCACILYLHVWWSSCNYMNMNMHVESCITSDSSR